MTGEYIHAMDSKGRLFMPARLREELGESFMVCRGLGGCLFAYSMEQWKIFSDRINDIKITEALKMQRAIFNTACQCEPDAQGRIIISQTLRKIAALEKNVVITGTGNHAEIWDEDKYEALDECPDEELGQYMDNLGF